MNLKYRVIAWATGACLCPVMAALSIGFVAIYTDSSGAVAIGIGLFAVLFGFGAYCFVKAGKAE